MRFDSIDYWSEVKLDIVREYATAYSTILAAQPGIRHSYIDAFSGPGYHVSKQTGQFVSGSPINALAVKPAFEEYHFIDLDGDKIDSLTASVDDPRVRFYKGDCNGVLLDQVFPLVQYGDYRRALCLLDPYSINLDWSVIQRAGDMGTIELFINFMVMDMNRNVLWRKPELVSPRQKARMTAFWGDESWTHAVYDTEPPQTSFEDAFGFEQRPQKRDNDAVAEAFRQRLMDVAGFKFVPQPMPMKNSTSATIYYLFFASPNATGAKIVNSIFSKYRSRGT